MGHAAAAAGGWDLAAATALRLRLGVFVRGLIIGNHSVGCKMWATVPASTSFWITQVVDRTASMSPEEAQTYTLAAFKVARACAAAGLLSRSSSSSHTSVGSLASGMTCEEALQRQARLQMLKFKHFDRRLLHMGQQLQELCSNLAAKHRARVRARAVPQGAGVGTAKGEGGTQGGAAKGDAESRAAGQRDGGTGEAAPVVLVVMGRHYVPALRAMWRDDTSALYRGSVPRSFADSV